jgi:hypothetical protein
VRVGEAVALVAPSALRAVVRRAGDCDLDGRDLSAGPEGSALHL